jgi:hypothetical protein
VVNVIYPWSQLTVPDPNFNASNGFPPRKVYIEAVDYLPGLAGESRNFDANGPYIRILGTGGTLTYSLQPGLFGQSLSKLDAVQPKVPPGGKRPPYEENVPCETQKTITDLSTPSSGPIQQTNSSLAAPGAQARWKGVVQNSVPELRQLASAAGLKLNTSQMGGGSASSGSGGGSSSGGGGSSSGGSSSGGSSSGGNPISQTGNAVGQAIAGVLKGS